MIIVFDDPAARYSSPLKLGHLSSGQIRGHHTNLGPYDRLVDREIQLFVRNVRCRVRARARFGRLLHGASSDKKTKKNYECAHLPLPVLPCTGPWGAGFSRSHAAKAACSGKAAPSARATG